MQETKIPDTVKEKHTAPMLPSWLAYLYAPILPYLKNIKIVRKGSRKYEPADILLPQGYAAEVVATDLNAPDHCCFDDLGFCYVVESGHKIETPPRILKINIETGEKQIFYQFPEERWKKTGAVTGACWHQGVLYVMNTDTLSRITPDGEIQDILTDLPGKGDHQSNYPVVGPDGKIYYGQGCATNSGVVGADDFAFEWLPKYPDFCDVPAQDITLVGRNFEYQNVLGSILEKVESGAYLPFGHTSLPGQVIRGSNRPSGAIMRCNPDGTNLEVVAWGLRNPYGVVFDNEGHLYCTEHGMDERSRRYIVDDPDDFYEIKEGEWYGWPDYASGIRMDDPYWGKGGQNREPLIQNPPNPNPPKPLVSFQTHAAANGVDICRDPAFGFEGQAFAACFGDLAPITTVTKAATPAGFKVMRVDIKKRKVYDFAINKIQGPAALLPHSGFERPSHCQFGPDGALYVVDYGEIKIALEKGGIRMNMGTGSLWRIRRTSEPRGDLPAMPLVTPAYLIRYLVLLLGIILGSLLSRWMFRRAKKK